MKRNLFLLSLLLVSGAVAEAYGQRGGYVDDLYRGSTRQSREAEKQEAAASRARRQEEKQQARQMPATWTPTQDAAAKRSVAESGVAGAARPELVTGYDEALQRRLEAYKSYREMDDTYWQLMEGYHKALVRKYDPDLYNVITFGNEMWVEPVYITALFDGSDPAGGMRTKELMVPSEQQTRTNISLSLNLGPGWWNDPWYDGWYGGPWGPSWRWRYYLSLIHI